MGSCRKVVRRRAAHRAHRIRHKGLAEGHHNRRRVRSPRMAVEGNCHKGQEAEPLGAAGPPVVPAAIAHRKVVVVRHSSLQNLRMGSCRLIVQAHRCCLFWCHTYSTRPWRRRHSHRISDSANPPVACRHNHRNHSGCDRRARCCHHAVATVVVVNCQRRSGRRMLDGLHLCRGPCLCPFLQSCQAASGPALWPASPQPTSSLSCGPHIAP